jgi:hypothetical protein
VLDDKPGAPFLDRAHQDLIVVFEQVQGVSLAPALGELGKALDVRKEDHQDGRLPPEAVLFDARQVLAGELERPWSVHVNYYSGGLRACQWFLDERANILIISTIDIKPFL